MILHLSHEIRTALASTWDVGEVVEISSTTIKPSWDNTPGVLTLKFDNQIARKVDAKAVNVIRVLDRFEGEQWPIGSYVFPLADPLAPSGDQQRLHETIKSLNRNLRFIKFHADGTGKGIRWGPVTP